MAENDRGTCENNPRTKSELSKVHIATEAPIDLGTVGRAGKNVERFVGEAQQDFASLAGTARNPNGQFVNFDPNWQPSGNTNADFIYLRDRITDLYDIEAR